MIDAQSQSLADLSGPIRALFTDLDGTLTSDNRLELATLGHLVKLFDAGLPVVLVTGRPAGWAHAMQSLWPFAASIAENGGVAFVPRSEHGIDKRFALPADELAHWRGVMFAAADEVRKKNSDARLSLDSAYREVDLAIDWNEDARLAPEAADDIVAFLHSKGLAASRSSVHVNFGPPGIDKAVMAQRVREELWPKVAVEEFVYVGDSLNDAPMFATFPESVGVANVADRWEVLPSKPRYVTKAREGQGFGELAERLLALR